MNRLKGVMLALEHVLSTEKKRHIVVGVLLCASIFLGGLALTAMSTKIEEKLNEQEHS